MQTETAKKIWSDQQLLMINALHMFSASYFSGDVKITEAPQMQRLPAGAAAKGDAADGRRGSGNRLGGAEAPGLPSGAEAKGHQFDQRLYAIGQSRPAGAVPAVPAASGSN